MTEQFSSAFTEADEADARLHIAGATADPTKDYLRSIGKTPLLNAEQEVELSKDIEAGLYAAQLIVGKEADDDFPNMLMTIDEAEYFISRGEEAKNHMIEANLRLVVSIAKRYTGRGLLFLDVIQEGNASLMHAVEKFDYTKGYKFSTYATWWIKQGITRAIADQGRTIRIPVHMSEVVGKTRRVNREMMLELGRDPTDEELADKLEMTAERLREIQKYDRQIPISIHTPIGKDGDVELGDLIQDSSDMSPDEEAVLLVQNEALRQVIAAELSEREAGIILRRRGLFDGKNWKLEEIGAVYGVTRERIRQIEGVAMNKLRRPAVLDSLREYLD